MCTPCLPDNCPSARAIFWGNCIGHFQLAMHGQNRVTNVVMGILETPPLFGQVISGIEYAFIGRVSSTAASIKLMQNFWHREINSFEIRHGTNALYLNHFKTFGISASYPATLEDLISKIRALWTKHQDDITKKTAYFRDFECRYDGARRVKKVNVSFSANEWITQEFTTGERQAGEWIKELCHFVREARKNEHLLSSEEQKVMMEIVSFLHVLGSVPSLIVKVRAGCPELRGHRLYGSIFFTLEDFIAHVKRKCPDWKSPVALSGYLQEDFLSKLREQQTSTSKEYEIIIQRAISPRHLEFELVESHPPFSIDYPHLAFDKPLSINSREIPKMRINRDGFSDLEEYQDSRFILDDQNSYTVITRKQLTEQDQPLLAKKNEMSKLRKAWLKAFHCELISSDNI